MLPTWACVALGAAIVVGEQWELLPIYVTGCTKVFD